MKLKIFDFVEETLEILDEKQDILHEIAHELKQYFTHCFGEEDCFLGINYRIKSPQSLKEKIIRNNFYMRYDTPEQVLEGLSDLIGIRIECRFIKDENTIYQMLLHHFFDEKKRGYFFDSLNPYISLKLRDRQPQIQKNGFEIYKIDGSYDDGRTRVKFELQIKSLVNVFWGEIDHRILYKNYNYMLTEGFFRDIMHSMKDNLSMIDRQLMILYNHVNSLDSSAEESNRVQVKSLLSKIIHDVYVNKVREDLGFLIDFKKTTDVIVEYLYAKCGMQGNYSYGENFIRMLNCINDIGDTKLDFKEYLTFDREPSWDYFFDERLGKGILGVLNQDFGWNLFFKIIFQIEKGDNSKDFELFITFLRMRLVNDMEKSLKHLNLSEEQHQEIVDFVLEEIVEDYENNLEIDYILEKSIQNHVFQIHSVLLSLKDFKDFKRGRERIHRNFRDNRNYEYLKPAGL